MYLIFYYILQVHVGCSNASRFKYKLHHRTLNSVFITVGFISPQNSLIE